MNANEEAVPSISLIRKGIRKERGQPLLGDALCHWHWGPFNSLGLTFSPKENYCSLNGMHRHKPREILNDFWLPVEQECPLQRQSSYQCHYMIK